MNAEHRPEHRVAGLSEIPPGEGRTFEVGGARVAIFHTRAGQVFATQAECPHRQGPLADGLVGGTTVVCPLHERAYDLRTGEGLNTDCALTVYPVRLAADGSILLRPVAAAAMADAAE